MSYSRSIPVPVDLEQRTGDATICILRVGTVVLSLEVFGVLTTARG
jgi:hypothetical protein